MAEVVFRGATKRYGDVTAVDRLDLSVAEGELLVLLGPSGCGKTTALRMVAGLEEIDDGEVLIGGEIVNDVEPRDRDVAMVFQSYALYPHLSVARNIEFPLRQRSVDAAERRRRVQEVAASLGLDGLLDRKPRQLSGGQRQRVALARAIVRSPRVFLMDEPLSNLDAALRLQTRADIVALQRRLATTTLYVTHDQVEAMTMGHRIAVMSGGVLQQVDTPEVLYERPANTVVAGFVGSPGMNLVAAVTATAPGPPGGTRDGGGVETRGAGGPGARDTQAGGGLAVQLAGGHLLVGDTVGPAPGAGVAVVVGFRAEDAAIDPGGTLGAEVVIVEMLGADVHVLCRLRGGDRVVLRQSAGAARPRPGEAVRLAVPPGRLHLFDPADGRRLGPDR